MTNILKDIVDKKVEEVLHRKETIPIKELEKRNMDREAFSLRERLLTSNEIGIIAEFKRKSPSKGILNNSATVEKTTTGYVEAGAIALSILTDTDFFGGSLEDLAAARIHNDCPILRKDFIIDEYQIIESKSSSADVILLIAAILTPSNLKKLAAFAKQNGLEVLLEIHTKEELDHLNEFVDIVGVNNRNLNDFTVSIDRSLELYDLISDQFIKISESGIDSPQKLLLLKEKGFKGFLMGERFMHNEYPERACRDFIENVDSINKNSRN